MMVAEQTLASLVIIHFIRKHELNRSITSSLEPDCYTLMSWYTQYYDMENSKTIVFDVYCSHWYLRGRAGKTQSESSVILSIFSLKYYNSTLCMERDRPLKPHLLWGRKHVFLITIYHDSKKPFVCTSGQRNSVISKLIPALKKVRGEYGHLSGFIWYVGVPGGPWHSLLMMELQPGNSVPASHLFCTSTRYITVWPMTVSLIAILNPSHH